MNTDKNREIKIMGIVNLTDDSYFADSRCDDVQSAINRIETMICEGADIIDIGACSTRPGSLPVGEEEEWARLEPVLKAVRARWPELVLSIDTYWSSVVRKSHEILGKFIVNDISAGTMDPAMLSVVGELGLTYIAMHMRGTPENMQDNTDYEDMLQEIVKYFEDFSIRAEKAGVREWILDPGFGFAKTVDQNYTLLSGLGSLKADYSGCSPDILVGVSRKSMIYKILGITPEESLPATQVLHLVALSRGADILRVHDVKEAVQTVVLYRKL